jgi:hypothetical protein
MQLEEFISATFKQLIDGVMSAQEYATQKGACVNPAATAFRTDQGMRLWDRNDVAPIAEVEFDVAVTATEGKESKGGIGIFVGSVGVGAQGRSDVTNQSISRIRFSLPLKLPST